MAGSESQTISQWVDTIDVHKDGVADILRPDIALKESLKKDLWILHGKVDDIEYNRYREAARAIFEKQSIATTEIRKEYMKERDKTLRNSNNWRENLSLDISNGLNKVGNIAMEGVVMVQQKIISDDTVQAYNKEKWNHLISIKNFEEQLKTQPLENINSLAMKNYLTYLKSKELLNKSVLEQKLGSPERLLELSVIWGTKMEKDEHIRNALWKSNGLGAKMTSYIHSGITGGVESTTEHIFKDVITNKIRQFGMEKNFLDKKGKNMNYEDIIKELEHLYGKNITGSMVGDFFKKKSQEWVQKIQQLQTEKKELTKDKTVWFFLRECQIWPNSAIKDILNKDINLLTKEEAKDFFKLFEWINTTHLPKDIKQLLSKEKEIQTQKKNNNELNGLIGNKPLMETIAQNHNHGKSTKEIVQSLNPTLNRIRMKQLLMEEDNLYKNELAQIGFSSISELLKNEVTYPQALSLLEGKWLQKSGLYKILEECKEKEKQFQKGEVIEYIKAVENKTEEQIQSEERNGRIIQWSAEELYKEDVKQKKTTDFTIPQWEKEQKYVNESDTRTENTKKILDTISNGEKVPLQEIGGDTCFVKKNGDRYTLFIDKKTDIICSKDEVESTLNSYRFLHEMGLWSIGSDMNEFLATIQSTSALCPDLDVKKWFFEPQKRALLGVVDTIFDLDMRNVMVSKSTETAHSDFIEKLNNETHKKGSFDGQLRKKWILNEGGFHREGLIEALNGRKTFA